MKIRGRVFKGWLHIDLSSLSPSELSKIESILVKTTKLIYFKPRWDDIENKVILEPVEKTVAYYDSNKGFFKARAGLTGYLRKILGRYDYKLLVEFNYECSPEKLSLENIKCGEPEKKLWLFDFQYDAYRKWYINSRTGTVAVPTGGGKTFIGLKAIYELKKPSLILVPTVELIKQWQRFIREYLGYEAGGFHAREKELKPITITTYNSVVKYKELFASYGFDILIADEVHHVPARTLMEACLTIPAPYRLGLSATPRRSDRNEHLIYYLIGDVVYRAKPKFLVEQGLTVPIIHNVVVVPVERRVKEELKRITEKSLSKGIVWTLGYRGKLSAVRYIVKKHKQDKIIIFTQYLDQAKRVYSLLYSMFREEICLITSKTKPKEREKFFKEFESGKKRVLVTTTCLDEGINVPDADVCIILSGLGERQMVQRVGRVCRKREGKDVAYVYEIITDTPLEKSLSKRRDVLEDFFYIKKKRIIDFSKILQTSERYIRKIIP